MTIPNQNYYLDIAADSFIKANIRCFSNGTWLFVDDYREKVPYTEEISKAAFQYGWCPIVQ